MINSKKKAFNQNKQKKHLILVYNRYKFSLTGIGQLAPKDGNRLADPEVLRRLTSSVSCALDEAAAALSRMRTDNGGSGGTSGGGGSTNSSSASSSNSNNSAQSSKNSGQAATDKISLVEACTDGDVGTVRKLLTEGRSVHETSEEGESLLSLACSAGYFELAQVGSSNC